MILSVNRIEFHKDGSGGRILDECVVRVVHPDADSSGEVCVKVSMVMQGYYNMEGRERSGAQRRLVLH